MFTSTEVVSIHVLPKDVRLRIHSIVGKTTSRGTSSDVILCWRIQFGEFDNTQTPRYLLQGGDVRRESLKLAAKYLFSDQSEHGAVMLDRHQTCKATHSRSLSTFLFHRAKRFCRRL